MTILQNIMYVKEEIIKSALKVKRDPRDIKIIGVTKRIAPGLMIQALDAGITDFGENQVQEFNHKADAIVDPGIKWHFIGHLQTNKVKNIIGRVELVHSLDRFNLALEISKRASALGQHVNTLVQVNVAGEQTKFGLKPEEVKDFVGEVGEMPGLRVKGLMTIAPYVNDPEEVRPYFKDLKNLADNIKKEIKGGARRVSMDYLSMGMSNDFTVAVEEGANILRLGTAIFGKRA